MAVKVVDVNNHPALEGTGTSKRDRLLFGSDDYHVWIHYSDAGDIGPMHKHTADQAFYGLKGECFINFPDGKREKITPGVLVVIPKGQYYQQEAPSHTGYAFLGTRAESFEKVRIDPQGIELPKP